MKVNFEVGVNEEEDEEEEEEEVIASSIKCTLWLPVELFCVTTEDARVNLVQEQF